MIIEIILVGIVLPAIVGLFGWVFHMNATIKVQGNELDNVRRTAREALKVNQDLGTVVTELRIAVEKINK